MDQDSWYCFMQNSQNVSSSDSKSIQKILLEIYITLVRVVNLLRPKRVDYMNKVIKYEKRDYYSKLSRQTWMSHHESPEIFL